MTLTRSDFSFHVPPELIAQYPASPRDDARLLCLRRETGAISHHRFRDLPDLLDPSYAVVVNDSRVIRARLFGHRPEGERVEVFRVRELDPGLWCCLGEGVPVGETLRFDGSTMTATLEGVDTDGTVRYRFAGVEDLDEEMERLGEVPLPPYVHERSGEGGYQTVYARDPGSVAAPTAGLHFTEEVLARLEQRGIPRVQVTLHVGYGTFASVQGEDLSAHRMHPERYRLDEATAARLNDLRREGRRLLTVGTTSTRLLETCADEDGTLRAGSGDTRLFIRPPYRFRAVEALLTNFHMPELTPIMLVAAFAGYDLTMKAYREALAERYRFFTFGDSMLVL